MSSGIRAYREYFTLILLAILGILESYVVTRYANAPFPVFVGQLAFVIVLFGAGIFLSLLPEYSVQVRRAVLGRDFVEGIWFDVIDGKIDGLETFGLISIEYRDGEIAEYGTNYQLVLGTDGTQPTLRPYTSWRSDCTSYRDGQLVLVNRVANRPAGHDFGVSFTEFDRFTTPPTGFSGSFLLTSSHLTSGSPPPGTFHGFKVTDKAMIQALAERTTNRVDRDRLIIQLTQDPRLRLGQPRMISAQPASVAPTPPPPASSPLPNRPSPRSLESTKPV
jgi:hypothetical protein